MKNSSNNNLILYILRAELSSQWSIAESAQRHNNNKEGTMTKRIKK
jgi:hypothetical protein